MSTGLIISVCMLGIVVAIALGFKYGVNMGVTGIVFAYIVGCFMMGLKVKRGCCLMAKLNNIPIDEHYFVLRFCSR